MELGCEDAAEKEPISSGVAAKKLGTSHEILDSSLPVCSEKCGKGRTYLLKGYHCFEADPWPKRSPTKVSRDILDVNTVMTTTGAFGVQVQNRLGKLSPLRPDTPEQVGKRIDDHTGEY